MPLSPLIGQVIPWPMTFAPSGWAFCQGQLLPIAQNTTLFSILGTTYGGDGETTFGLPDLQRRVAIHAGQVSGLSTYPLGSATGLENVTLSVAQLGAHSHPVASAPVLNVTATTDDGDQPLPNATHRLAAAKLATGQDVNLWSSAAPDTSLGGLSVSGTFETGANPGLNGQSHSNIQPVLGIHYIIALVGIFPSRN